MRPLLLCLLIACSGEKDSGTPADDSGTVPTDRDGDGVLDADDCAPDDPAANSGLPELCDGVDNDCDGQTDEEAEDQGTWYPDLDGDGYGDGAAPVVACAPESGQLAQGGDCDDADGAAYPGADEQCDGADDDCDGEIDEDYSYPMQTWYKDADADGYGDETQAVEACEPPEGFSATAGDCDDEDPAYWDDCPVVLAPVVWSSDCDVGAGYTEYEWAIEEPFAPELHVLGAYEANDGDTIHVYVGRTTTATLVLSAYNPVHWIVEADTDATITEVILNGYEVQTAEVPTGTTLTDRSPYDVYLSSPSFNYPSRETTKLLDAAEALTGLDATSFMGCYTFSDATLE